MQKSNDEIKQNKNTPHPQFFYPSTEWDMAQPFTCICNTPSCRGRISGAKTMTQDQLAGYWLSGHIRELKAEQQRHHHHETGSSNGHHAKTNGQEASSLLHPPTQTQPLLQHAGLDRKDPTVQALQEALAHAEKVVVAAKSALVSYLDVSPPAEAGRR